MTKTETAPRDARKANALKTPSDLDPKGIVAIADELRQLLADVFALYVKTKNFHWHMSGPHFRDYHLLLDDQATHLFATTDPIAERVRKLDGLTLKSIGQIAGLQRVSDNNAEAVAARDMLVELLGDNRALAMEMRQVHALCDEADDVATASLLENWIDEADGRVWFLFEATRDA